jgi:hypothetical protein
VERETRTALVLPGRAAAELALAAAIGCALYLGNRPRRETAAVHREQPGAGPALGDVA